MLNNVFYFGVVKRCQYGADMFDVAGSRLSENGVSRKILVNSFYQVRPNPYVSLYEAVVLCMCNLFSAVSSLDNSFAKSIKLSERENDKLCSVMKATSMASILATLSNT